jgi:holo-[acyl-carrier protein] synthase
MVIGHGIDLVEHSSFSRLVSQEETFLKRCFGETEISTGKAASSPVQWFASRFAAKEAVMKALGTGWSQGVSWHDIRIAPCSTGGLTVLLSGKTADIAGQRGITGWLLSLSHSEQFSVGSAIATSEASNANL